MLNILYAILAGAAVFSALFFPGVLGLGEAIVPGILAVMIAYYLLARRTFKQVEGLVNVAANNLQSQPPRFELAIQGLEKAYQYNRVQFGVRTQIDSQIGVIYFLQKEFTKALPYLAKSTVFGHWLGVGMLAVIHYKKKHHDEMRKVLETVTKRGKKQSLAWNLRAYLLCQIGDRDAAQRILVEGLKKTKDDPKVKEALLQLQNGKKIKMRGYKEQWYQFHLERPPAQYQMQAMPMRGGKAARRGRW